jgi:hypothetical protein
MRRELVPILRRGRLRSRRGPTRRTLPSCRQPIRSRWLRPARIRRRTKQIPSLRRRHRNREHAQHRRYSKRHRSSGPHLNRRHRRLQLPSLRLLLLRPRSGRRPSGRRLLPSRPRGSSPSERHRPHTRRRLPPRDLLQRHVRRPHQGHPSVHYRCVELRVRARPRVGRLSVTGRLSATLRQKGHLASVNER